MYFEAVKESLLEHSIGSGQSLAGSEARFHRFRVGQISCTALSDGGILVPRPLTPVSKNQTGSGAAEPQNKTPEYVLIPLSCLVVQMPQTNQVVLIDSGFGLTPEVLGKPMQSAGRLLDSLEAAGLTAKDIDIVLISHLDIDHVAGLYDVHGSQVFPNATYYASSDAVQFWSEENIDLSFSPVLPWIKKERLLVSAHVLKCAGERLKTFHAGDELLPGIKTMALPGHAPGQVGFVLSSEGETLLYTADAITNAVISLETPEVHNMMDLDPHLAVKTRLDLIASLKDLGWRSFSPHFPWPSWGRVQKQGEKHVWKSGE